MPVQTVGSLPTTSCLVQACALVEREAVEGDLPGRSTGAGAEIVKCSAGPVEGVAGVGVDRPRTHQL